MLALGQRLLRSLSLKRHLYFIHCERVKEYTVRHQEQAVLWKKC